MIPVDSVKRHTLALFVAFVAPAWIKRITEIIKLECYQYPLYVYVIAGRGKVGFVKYPNFLRDLALVVGPL